RAGNDLIMPGEPRHRATILEAIKSGALKIEDLDRNVERILKTVLKSLSYQRYQYSDKPDLKGHAQIARKAAAEGVILLKNENNTLPLAGGSVNIAAFGVGSYDFIAGGTGSGDVNNDYTVSLVEGLEEADLRIDAGLKKRYDTYIKTEKAKLPEKKFIFELLPPIPEMPLEEDLLVAKASDNDIALITIGRNSGEFQDRQTGGDFYLTFSEVKMIRSVSQVFRAAHKKVVVVLNIGNVIETVSWRDAADAIVLPWQGGQEAGHALTDVLTDHVNPSGKLPTTFTRTYEDVLNAKDFPGIEIPDGETHELGGVMTSYEMEITYHDDIWVGYRHYVSRQVPVAYPFGFGLSYTTFQYRDLQLSAEQFNGELMVETTIKNTGDTAGKEVVQLYLAAPGKSMEKPLRELKGFVKTRLLQPNESQVVTFRLTASELASFDPEERAWITEAGMYRVQIGASSTDIRLEEQFSVAEVIVKRVN
ncbi:MAG: glycoside hydrolase family 3 C-terminal domain-containing protein, partial [Bacteroidota bacterium]